MNKVYNKLVRNKIPEIIINNGENPSTRILNDEEYTVELINKLKEECKEVENATIKEDILEECADVLQVLEDIAKLNQSTLDDVINIKKKKEEKRGGFDSKIFLESVEENVL